MIGFVLELVHMIEKYKLWINVQGKFENKE
jgi:hypothetical protein